MLCDLMNCRTPGLPVPHHLLKFAQVHVHCIGDAIQPSHLCHPLLLLSSIFPSNRDFSNESAVLIRCPKYWSFSFSISPSKEYSGLISLQMDWFDLLPVPGTLRSLLQHHISKASNSVIFNKDSGGLHVDFLSSVSAKSSPFRNPTLLSQSPWPLWSSNSVSMTQ